MKVKELLEKLKDVNPEAYIGIEILSNMENSNAGVCNGTIAFDEIKIEDNWVTLIPWQKLIRLPRLEENKPTPCILIEKNKQPQTIPVPYPTPDPYIPLTPVPSYPPTIMWNTNLTPPGDKRIC